MVYLIREEPFFMQNREWYTTPSDHGIDDMFFEDGRGYHIRDDAPEEAKRSYEEFYNPGGFLDDDGNPLAKAGMSVVY